MNAKLKSYIGFLGTLLVVWGIVCWIIGSFLQVCFDLTLGQIVWVCVGLFLVLLGYVGAEFRSRSSGKFRAKHVASIALGSLSILFSNTVVGYIAICLGFWAHGVGIAVVLATFLMVLWASYNHHADPLVTQLSIALNKSLPKSLKLVQLSDIHLNGLNSLAHTKRLVDTVNSLQPDVILFTGDLLDISFEQAKQHLHCLAKLQASVKLAVSGNHDFYGQYDEFLHALQTMDFDCLDNQKKEVLGIQFVGLPDVAQALKTWARIY